MAHVLLVEDNNDLAMLFTLVLEGLGHQVHHETTLAGAERALDAKPFEAVLSDLQLPDGSALDWVGPRRDAHPGLRWYATSSYGAVMARKARDAGFDAYLDKGEDLTALEKLLGDL